MAASRVLLPPQRRLTSTPCWRRSSQPSAYPEVPTPLRGHPLTGPVYVAGAAPGDTLRVTVLDVQPGAWGWTACGPGNGLLGDEFTERVTQFWDLRHGERPPSRPAFACRWRPFAGCWVWRWPNRACYATTPPGMAGGNLDIRQLTAGAILDLPVPVPAGAVLYGRRARGQGGRGGELRQSVAMRRSPCVLFA